MPTMHLSRHLSRRRQVDQPPDTAGDPWATPPPRPSGRRSVPHLLLGILLVLACAVGSLALSTGLGGSRLVLASARPLTVGQILGPADVREVALPAGSDLRAIDASGAASLLGRPVTVTVPAGVLLTPESFGGDGSPPPGRAIVALALEPGRLPPEVAPGDRVSVVVGAPDAAPGTGAGGRGVVRSWQAVVVGAVLPDSGRLTVVSVMLEEAPARELAALPAGQVSVVLLGTGG